MNNEHLLDRIVHRGAWASGLFLFIGLPLVYAAPPAELPGEEITEKQYFEFMVPRDSIEKQLPDASPESPTWLDRVSETWDAPSIAVQMANDSKKTSMGMGAVFIPSMSDPTLEPEVEIMDSTGEIIASGKTGRKYNLIPGNYYVMLGSGSHNQKIVKSVKIIENIKKPLIPDWCGLTIDVVDENNLPFRGEYEMARIDKFTPHGRGFGGDPDLGEKVKTWVLKPGIYKIFGVGQSYNTLTNFVTVRLFPGEFIRFTLVQENDAAMQILGGGTIETKVTREIATNWKYHIDVGGGIDFNATYDHDKDSTTNNETSLSMIFRSQLNYEKNKIDWENRLRLSEEVRVSQGDWQGLNSSVDELQLRSTYTWRFVPWLGPYGRFEINTELFPEYVRAPKNDEAYYFILFNEEYKDPQFNMIDDSYKLQPSFSPLSIEPGIGANVTMPSKRYIEAKLLSGLGLKYNRVKDESEVILDSTKILFDSLSQVNKDLLDSIKAENISHIYLRKYNDQNTVEVGPEVILNVLLYLGRIATIETELKYFAPFDRISRPDIALRSTLSWRIIRVVTLDYEYEYALKQPAEEALKQNESRHRILIRFSYTSR